MIDKSARGGFVLVLALLSVVMIGALIVATHSVVHVEHNVTTAAIGRQRAFAIGEYALWSTVANWDPATGMLSHGSAMTKVIYAGADSATVTTVRLNDSMYWITTDAAVESAQWSARRRTGISVRAVAESSGVDVGAVPRSWVELY